MNGIKKASALFLAIALAAAGGLAAEQSPEDSKMEGYDAFTNALGVYATALADDGTGGLHFQQWGKRFGWQGMISAFYDPEEKFGRKLDYAFIVDGLYTVYGNTFSRQISGRLYTWASLGHRGYIASEYAYQDTNLEPDTIVLNGVAGLGIGIEIITFGHFSFPLQFGYYATFPTDPRITFSAGSGFRYRF